MTSSSFFEKLKKGMGVESPIEVEEESDQETAKEEISSEKEKEVDNAKE